MFPGLVVCVFFLFCMHPTSVVFLVVTVTK